MFVKLSDKMVVNTDNITVVLDEYGKGKNKNMYVVGVMDDNFLLNDDEYDALIAFLSVTDISKRKG